MNLSRKHSPEAPLPLKELELLILLCVESTPQHGYALLDSIVERSAAFVKPGPASLYRTLAALEEEGLLEEVSADPSDDPRRRYFGASARGRAVLRAELKRLERLLADAKALGIRLETGGR